jgi:hypothetical protein
MTRRTAAAALALALLAGCTSGGSGPVVSPPSPGPQVMGSAAAAMAALCRRPPLDVERATPSKDVPDVIVSTEHQVEAVRGLSYEHPVAAAAVSHEELNAGLEVQFAHSYPRGQTDRRNLAWQTIGVLPKTSDLEDDVHRYLTSQVIGYYDPASKELRYIGTEHPTPPERFVLAHELTHALDDQHFRLVRINGIENRCQDEQLEASIGAVEGSAVFFSSSVVFRFFTPRDQNAVATQSSSQPEGIPQFLLNLMQWPYIAGPRFIRELQDRGGLAEVNAALRNFPVSTEQIIHPGRYPSDVPTPLDIPDLGPKLGSGWTDLDVEVIGEEWLQNLLGLREDPLVSEPAAAGWDGGLYRAWQQGPHVAVVMGTAWDSDRDAREFASALGDWARGHDRVIVRRNGRRVTALFASDPSTLDRLGRLGLSH